MKKDRTVARVHIFAVASLALAVTGALALVAPGQAFAEKKRVGIPRFAGPQEALIRKAVMQAVKAHGYEMIKSAQIESTTSSIGASLDSNDGFRSLAKELSIAAFVTGEVGKKKAKLTVRNGGDGTVNAEETFSGANPRKLASDVAKTFWKRLGSAIERGKPPAGAKKSSKVVADESPDDKEDAPEAGAGGDDMTPAAATEDKPSRAAKGDDDGAASKPKRTAKAEKSDDGESAKAEKGDGDEEKKAAKGDGDEKAGVDNTLPRALDAWIGPRLFFRNLAFHQIASGTDIQDYRPVPLGAVGLLVDWYPAAHATSGVASWVGIEVNVEQAFGVSSSTKSGATYATDVHDYSGAVRLRIPVGALELGVIGGYGQQAFTLSGSGRDTLHLPDTTYNYARVGGALRIAFGNLAVSLGGAWRQIFSVGGMKTYFPHLRVGGVDANLSVSYRITSLIEARVGGDLRRYFYDMHSRAGDANLAGGAIDQTIAFMGGLAFVIDGVPKSAARAEEKSDDAGDGEADAPVRRKKKAKPVEDSDSASEE